jgi:hypothetical protein
MDPGNPNNGGKWQAWSKIGFDVDTAAGRQAATDAILPQPRAQLGSLPATPSGATQWGNRLEVDAIIGRPAGKGTLKTFWQVENGIPRMITNWLESH